MGKMRTFAHVLAAGLVASAGFVGISGVAFAAQQEALLVEGKHALYQRIVTKPAAMIFDTYQPTDFVLEEDVPPLSIYYVYDRKEGMVQVGSNVRGEPAGWIKEEQTVDWKQAIVVEFNNRANAQRDRVLFFKDKDALETALDGDDFQNQLNAARTAALAGDPDAGGIVAVEPDAYVDIDQNFYLLPILQYEEAFLPFGQIGNYLEVASLSARREEPEPVDDFRAGVVFVIDTTQSMQPYIDETRRAIEQMQQILAASEVGSELRFGLVGFRQSEQTNPDIGYHVRDFQPLDDDASAERFIEQIRAVTAAKTSTDGFDEDSSGGVFEAIQNTDWDAFQARYVILVTDAGPRSTSLGDSYAGDLGVDQLASLAEQKNVRLLAIHLKTTAAPDDHAYAESAYRSMTMRDGQSSYLGVDGGRADAFAPEIQAIARQLVSNVVSTRDNRPIEIVDDSAGAALMARAGQAMELEYLGARNGELPPDFFKAWTVDMAAENPAVRALDVRLMLTRNQLSSLATALRSIVEAGEGALALSDPLEFFRRAQELAARASNDTEQIGDDTPLGNLMGEYLDELPYRSPVLSMTSQDWVTLGRASQRDLLLSLKSKLALYERVHNNPDKWIKLHPDAQEGESVTTIPLYQLP